MTKEELQELLSKNNLSQRKLAEKLGVHEVVVSRWINGRNKISNAYIKLIELAVKDADSLTS